MKSIGVGLWILFLFVGGIIGVQAGVNDTYAEIKTTDGVIYKSCTVTKLEPDGITIMYSDGATKILYSKLSVELQQKYHYDPAAADKYAAEQEAKRQALLTAKLNAATVSSVVSTSTPIPADVKTTAAPAKVPVKYHYDPFEPILTAAENPSITLTLKTTDAFSLSQLEDAKKKAVEQHKPLGFIMVWGQFFDQPTDLVSHGSTSGAAHFYYVFKDQLVLVFVRHETELGSVPDAVKKGFFGPEEGGFAPNMAVTDSMAQTYVCEIPFGGNDSNGAIRTKVFREGFTKIRGAQAVWDQAEADAHTADSDKNK